MLYASKICSMFLLCTNWLIETIITVPHHGSYVCVRARLCVCGIWVSVSLGKELFSFVVLIVFRCIWMISLCYFCFLYHKNNDDFGFSTLNFVNLCGLLIFRFPWTCFFFRMLFDWLLNIMYSQLLLFCLSSKDKIENLLWTASCEKKGKWYLFLLFVWRWWRVA